jgi:hypothetical protein
MSGVVGAVKCAECGQPLNIPGTFGQQGWCSIDHYNAWVKRTGGHPILGVPVAQVLGSYPADQVRELIAACSDASWKGDIIPGVNETMTLPWRHFARILCALEDLNGGPDLGPDADR